jgi:hypothetical protein
MRRLGMGLLIAELAMPAADVFPIHVEPSSQTVRRSSSTTFEMGPARTCINDVTFTDYHVFGSESRILFDENR